jgi:hypothetical protein
MTIREFNYTPHFKKTTSSLSFHPRSPPRPTGPSLHVQEYKRGKYWLCFTISQKSKQHSHTRMIRKVRVKNGKYSVHGGLLLFEITYHVSTFHIHNRELFDRLLNYLIISPLSPANSDYTRIQNCREKTTLINAHESRIAMLSVNFDGTILATASDKGTLIRV